MMWMRRRHRQSAQQSTPTRYPMRGAQDAEAAVVYSCPMHPAVRQDRPGACPICGMDLKSLSS
ncbi:MAG: heavy metal-binding domain-containing protein [Gemmatimonadales bacterium]